MLYMVGEHFSIDAHVCFRIMQINLDQVYDALCILYACMHVAHVGCCNYMLFKINTIYKIVKIGLVWSLCIFHLIVAQIE